MRKDSTCRRSPRCPQVRASESESVSVSESESEVVLVKASEGAMDLAKVPEPETASDLVWRWVVA
jgi:hypothetical protein